MGTKTYNNYEDLLTFTRASKGHALRPVSYGTELVTNGDFATDSVWTKQTGWTISGGSASCDGSSATNSYIQQEISGVRRDGTVYLIEFDVTARTGGGNVLVFFGSGSSSSISDANTTGRKSVVRLLEGTNDRLYIGCPSGNTMTIDNVSVKEVTFDQPDGTLTLFEHPDNIPRVEWDAQRNRLGLLVEEARTNLDTQSTYFSGAASVTATKNYTAPDGSQDASTLDYTAVFTPYLNTTNISFSSGTTYSFSFYFKRGTGTQAVQTLLYGSAFNSGGANCVVIFDLDNETTSVASGTFVSHSITNVGGGWYRCMCSATATATVSQKQQILRLGGADDGNYDYIWGKQVEAGSFPTSYIKTTGATATRSADVASIPVADFGYNQSAGTLFSEFRTLGSGIAYSNALTDGTASNMILQFRESDTTLRTAILFGGSDQNGGMKTATTSAGESLKFASAFSLNDIAQSLNGAAVQTESSASIPSGISSLRIGNRDDNTRPLNGHIKSIRYYPRRLTNAQLQELTS